MTCSCFQTASPLSRGTLDPSKRVNYTLGLVLGEDEFRQEQLYFFERDKLLNRLLHGYGVACGLRVTTAPEGGDFEVRVEPGLALTPRGNVVRVPEAQCARIGAWLQRHRDEVLGHLGSPPAPGPFPLYVRLCFRDCETDPVPIPGGPCRSQEDSLAPSRITDSFELELSLEPPDQAEEDIVRRFGELLGRLDIEEDQPSDITEEEMEDLVRGLLEAGSPPSGPASPPGSTIIHVHPDDIRRILRAAYRVWVGEVRPAIPGGGCTGEPQEDCVLLARLDLDVDDDLEITSDPEVSVDRRPVLLHTRLLQEMMTGATDIEDVNVHAELKGLDADDHKQYLLTNGTRALTGDQSAGGHRITNLAQANANGQAVRFEQAIKQGDAASGDLAGTYPSPLVVRLFNRVLDSKAPADKDVLTFDGAKWTPKPPQAGGNAGGDLTGTYPNPTVARLQTRAVDSKLPASNDVLTFDGSQWTPKPAAGGQPPPQIEIIEDKLVRIERLSWPHGGFSPFELLLNGGPTKVTAVALSFTDVVFVRPGSLDDMTFQLFTEGPGDLLRPPLRIVPIKIFPIAVTGTEGGLITEVQSTGELSHGAILVFDRKVLDNNPGVAKPVRLTMVLRGDFVLDKNGRAVDAEFLRSELPTGSHPAGSKFGLQGGRFESWAEFGTTDNVRTTDRVVIRGGFDLNTVTRDQLMTLPGVGPATADLIIARRNQVGRFRSLDDLEGVTGITATMIKNLRPE